MWARAASLILPCVLLPAIHTLAGERPDFAEGAAVLRAAVADGAFPGGVVCVGTSREVLWCQGFGRLALGESSYPADPSSLYDLASLTKVVGTTTVVLCLVRDGRMTLDEPLAKRLPGFLEAASNAEERQRRSRVTIEHLLTHSAGLSAWKPLFERARSYDELLAAVVATPLDAAPGERYRYSDLGLILLGEAVARAGGKPLPDLERELVFAPLGMRHTRRNPPASWRPWIAPTEREGDDGPFIHGVVHDENARAGEGRTGHAGLFSTAWDLSVFATELLRAHRGESRLFPRELLRRFVRPRGIVEGSSRGLGWDTPSGRSSAGDLLSRKSFGHTGFTGTSLWLDPERDVHVILLSNRVHPSRQNRKIGAVRRALADAVARAIDVAQLEH